MATTPGNQRYIVLSFFGAAFALAMTIRGVVSPLFLRFEIDNPSLFGLADATTVAGFALGAVAFFVLLRHAPALQYTDEVVTELRRVVWPSKDDTLRSTGIVLGVTFVLTVTIAFYDLIWSRVTGAFLFTEG